MALNKNVARVVGMILKVFLQLKLFYNSNEKTTDLYSYISYVSGLDP